MGAVGCTAYVLSHKMGGLPDTWWPSSPKGTVGCTVFVLSYRTSGQPGHLGDVVANRDGRPYCMKGGREKGRRRRKDGGRKVRTEEHQATSTLRVGNKE